MPNILAIDTSSDVFSAALQTEQGLYAFSADAGNAHSEILCAVIDNLVAVSCIERSDIGIFACMKGPGSFSGLRIGFSTVKALALAFGKKYVSAPTLDCIAFPYSGFKGCVAALLDAKQKRFFCRLYKDGAPLSDVMDAGIETIAALLPSGESALFTGAGAPLAFERLAALSSAALSRVILSPNARGAKAKDLLNFIVCHGRIEEGDDDFSSPVYVRPAL